MKIRMSCFSGFGYLVQETGATAAEFNAILAKREKQGYEVDRLSPNEAEINGDFAIDDFMGILTLEKEI